MRTKLLLLAVLLGLIGHHVYFFYGHFGFDDLHYAELASELLHGRVDFANQYSYRIVPIGLTALSYAAFGISDWSTALPALLASAIILLIFYRLFRFVHFWMLVLALVAYFGMPWNLFYSDKLMPDIFVSAFCFGGWAAYLQYRTKGRAGPQVQAVIAAVCLFLAFNSKGTVILLVPLFTVYLIHDLLRGRWRFWLTFTAVCILLLTIYLGAIYLLTGSALARFSAIAGTHYLNPCSYDILPRAELWSRLTYGFYGLIGSAGMLPHLVTAVVGLGVIGYGGKAYRGAALYPITTLLSLASINFMTISLTSYNPVCLDPRHILLFSPILSVCSVLTLAAILRVFGWRTDTWGFRIAAVVASALLLYPTLRQVRYGTTVGYERVKLAYTELIEGTPRPVVLYGSEVSTNLGHYYTRFAGDTGGIYFRNLDALPDCPTGSSDTTRYLLQSWYADWHAGLSRDAITRSVAAHGTTASVSELEVSGLELSKLECN
ncbi:ArnT family glycosyltransferase [Neolewinella sp.]|uniref:ArnT family glycosyltransferase n=1 Tax=Neolewinella sp. TaxID=2993543 RepID=UPI003B5245BF